MFIPIDTPVDSCIGDDYFESVFSNLEFLNECVNGASQQVLCSSVDESESARLRRSFLAEACITLQSADPLVNSAGAADSRKVLIFDIDLSYSARYNDSDNPGTITRSSQAYIRCNGTIIKTLTAQELDYPLAFAEFNCPPNSDVEICVQASQNNSGSAILQANSTFTVSVCGSLICFEDVVNQLAEASNYFPVQFSEGCCYSRDAIHLINQNLTALGSTLSASGQLPSCQTLEFNNGDDNTIINTAPTETTYLIMGRACVTGQNASTDTPATITVEPRFTCENEQISCNSASTSISATGGDGPVTNTACANVVICGTCAAGESLQVSLRSELVCNETPSQIVSGFQTRIIDISQSYCVYLFARPVFDLGDELIESIGPCFDIDVFRIINSRLNALAAACDSREPVQLDSTPIEGVAGRGDCVTLRPPQPWPPLNDPTNPNPAPIGKQYMLASIFPRVTNVGGLNTEELRRVRASVEILCGGSVIESASSTWTLANSGFVRQSGPSMGFSQCIECPIDQPIEVCFDSSSLTLFTPEPNEFFYRFQFFNFF